MTTARSLHLNQFNPIPKGWYRICELPELEQKKEVSVSLLGGRVTARYSTPLAAHFTNHHSGPQSKLTVIEILPFLFAWFPPSSPPDFELLPRAPLIRDGWSYPFHLRWKVRSNMIEIAENAVDMGHFTSVHVYKEHARLMDFKLQNHRMSVEFESARRALGIRVPVKIGLHYQGLGWVESQVRTPMFEAHVLYTPTPIDHQQIDILLSLSFRKTRSSLFNSILRLALPWEVRRDFERDIPIWENKVILSHPTLCAADGPIMKLRRWAMQFYQGRLEFL